MKSTPSKTHLQQRALVIGLIIVGILFTAFFGMRVFHAFRKFDGHRPPPHGKVETDVELIRDWMTVPFISHMYHVPDEIIFEELKVPPKENRDKSLKILNDEYFPNQDGHVLDLVKKTILEHQPPTPPASSNTPTATPAP